MPARTLPVRLAHYAPILLLEFGVIGALLPAPTAHADNKRLNDGVLANIYTAQHQNGCTTNPRYDGRLIDAARRHADDVLNNHDLSGDIGSDGSTPQDRANAAGFTGKVAETVATNPALAINNLDVLNQWWYDPPSRAIMQDCANTAIGVWSDNSINRSVVVAVYGHPGAP
jgi:uncharacterized protein YkwD